MAPGPDTDLAGRGMPDVGRRLAASLLCLCPSEQAARCPLSRFYYYPTLAMTPAWPFRGWAGHAGS